MRARRNEKVGIGFKIKNKQINFGPIQALNGLQIGSSGSNFTRVQKGTLDFVVGTIAPGTVTTVNNTSLSAIGTADVILGAAEPSNLQNGVGFRGFRVAGAGTVAAVFEPVGAAAGTVNGTVSIPYVWFK